MTGWEFERWLEGFFKTTRLRRSRRTPYRGDFGADFVLTWNKHPYRCPGQTKRPPSRCSALIQEVVAAKAYYKCDHSMVVTNNYFTEQALILARANGVWDTLTR